MAIPVAQAAGAQVNSGTTGVQLQPLWGSHLSFDVGFLIMESASEQVSVLDPQTFVHVPGFPFSNGAAGLAGSSALDVWWARATSGAMPAPTIVCPGDHVVARIVSFRGCAQTGDPWDVINGDATAATTVVAVPGGTTTGIDRLIVVLLSNHLDSGINRINNDWANVDLAAPAIAEFTFAQTLDANGGGWNLATGGKAAAGPFTTSSATVVGGTALASGRASIALKPATDPGAGGTILPGRNYG